MADRSEHLSVPKEVWGTWERGPHAHEFVVVMPAASNSGWDILLYPMPFDGQPWNHWAKDEQELELYFGDYSADHPAEPWVWPGSFKGVEWNVGESGFRARHGARADEWKLLYEVIAKVRPDLIAVIHRAYSGEMTAEEREALSGIVLDEFLSTLDGDDEPTSYGADVDNLQDALLRIVPSIEDEALDERKVKQILRKPLKQKLRRWLGR